MGPIQLQMRKKLIDAFAPLFLEITDESARHASHIGAKLHAAKQGGASVVSGETHFSIHMISAAFEGQSLVARQRAIYQVLAEELSGPVHALSLKAEPPLDNWPVQAS
ncbi:BolA family protein [Candidatus Phycosocius spiralis]|uniref:BolA family transcriptional regulator n=1 Tax=Candidatus Phycosocius spiralis TaxID=2815099 RepID=A0ABQ4PTL4_9PROT|nr:BolA family protein [Candidatus Phycosocius spiralis]GIU66360.1 BolA family transcriptional regulator [Candidatus Phycosocius spiralis]